MPGHPWLVRTKSYQRAYQLSSLFAQYMLTANPVVDLSRSFDDPASEAVGSRPLRHEALTRLAPRVLAGARSAPDP